MNCIFRNGLVIATLFNFSCEAQEPTVEVEQPKENATTEPHRYGGWYCPDNFGFEPVNIQNLDEVPAISDRLPTEEELKNHKSLINVDHTKYPDARAYDMDLPRVASIYSRHSGMNELAIVIQAIIVQEDTVVGYRFANGGNGSARINEVTFLSDSEVKAFGSQPFYYSKSTVKASAGTLWNAMSNTDYFKNLGKKFSEQSFFTSDWNPDSFVNLHLDEADERAVGYVGMTYGNYYLHIDYVENGNHYSEKVLMVEDEENGTTELFVARGPFPENYDAVELDINQWLQGIITTSESH